MLDQNNHSDSSRKQKIIENVYTYRSSIGINLKVDEHSKVLRLVSKLEEF